MSRSVLDQIQGGLRYCGAGLIVMFTLLLLLFGINAVIGSQPSSASVFTRLAGLAALALAVTILALTVRIWCRWSAAVALLAGLRTVIVLITGTTLSVPFRPYPRIAAAEAAICCILAAALLLRYVSHRPTLFERVVLVAFVVAVCSQIIVEHSRVPILIGVFMLSVSWLVRRQAATAGRKDPDRVPPGAAG